MPTRRDFLKMAALLALPPVRPGAARRSGHWVNDVHSQLNRTRVASIATPDSLAALQRAVREARRSGRALSIAGARHAMGGQQFGADTVLVDTRGLSRLRKLDREWGMLEVEAGSDWRQLIRQYLALQEGQARQWGIAQKQTGADLLTVGGALAANAHGRGLRMKPFVADVVSFELVDAEGEVRRCSRTEEPELFRLVAGGYGLFGIVSALTLQLVPRQKVERVVEVTTVEGLIPAIERRVADGFLYGDFQFSIDETSDDFLRRGVFSCYRPVDPATPMPAGQKELSDEDWARLIYLAHTERKRTFETYASYYLSTSGQIYWSDTHQLGPYLDNYHRALDERPGAEGRATEIISEIYVPRDSLAAFLEGVRRELRERKVPLIYGTIRMIERDDESFLAWAKQPYACIIFNLHTPHTPQGRERSAEAFRRMIDLAIVRGGSYYLTYHRYATRAQVEGCYPQFPEFLRQKRKYDSRERFQSDWYRHYRKMFG